MNRSFMSITLRMASPSLHLLLLFLFKRSLLLLPASGHLVTSCIPIPASHSLTAAATWHSGFNDMDGFDGFYGLYNASKQASSVSMMLITAFYGFLPCRILFTVKEQSKCTRGLQTARVECFPFLKSTE
ncbi:hypothetical protein F503_03828 [Ophiostoma piceae UAMH 11346]|uniref:Secreted protein n=1 Tax=Ophiostoma piceae (strain UAMH 11346) TaxID=1262450 RepID=S3CG42_OPHP1|nr:hypothetical protein F503_03828 [Ophiostoma piceae UAMH 11346]